MFISFEGVDGCGKTTQIQKLTEHFTALKKKVLSVREPGGTLLSEELRFFLLNSKSEMSDLTELFLFQAARSELVTKMIRPALDNNSIVLSDRFCDSTIAYQGYGRGLDLSTIQYLNQIATGGLQPDLTFLLRIDLHTHQIRKNTRDRMELIGNDFIQKIITAFDTIASENPERFVVINATLSIEEVFSEILNKLDNYS